MVGRTQEDLMTHDSPADRRMAGYGMTAPEIALWNDLARVAGQFLQLPVLHPHEREEVVTELHLLQNRLLARPGLRVQGWPSPGTSGAATTDGG